MVDPVPLRKYRPELPEWLQEVVLRCLEPEAAKRYRRRILPFDHGSHPDQVTITARGRKAHAHQFWARIFGAGSRPPDALASSSPIAAQQADEVPIVMVAVPHKDVTDATCTRCARRWPARWARAPVRLVCVTVIRLTKPAAPAKIAAKPILHRRYLTTLRQWAQPLEHPGHQASFHVLESAM